MKLVFIRVYKDNKLLFVKQFPPSDPILIGNDPGAVLRLDSPKVSVAHALIEKREDNFFISDLGAEEGVHINGVKSIDSQIKYGDSIQIGDFKLEFFDSIPKPTASKPQPGPNPNTTPVSKPDTKPKSVPFNLKSKMPPPSPPDVKANSVKPDIKKLDIKKLDIKKLDIKKPGTKKSDIKQPDIKKPGIKTKPNFPKPPPPPGMRSSLKTSLKDRIKEVKDKNLTIPDIDKTDIDKMAKPKKIPKPPAFQHSLSKATTLAAISKNDGSFEDVEDKINLSDIKPSKGPVAEILVAWGNRVIDSKHFTKNVVTIGSNSSNDILLPYVRGANHRIVSRQSGKILVFVPKGCNASVITKTTTLGLKQIENSGRVKPVKNGLEIDLKQEEMVQVHLSDSISILARRVPRTIKPLMLPITGLSVRELTNVVLTIGLSVLMAIFFVISDQSESVAEEKKLEDKKERKALFVYKPPPEPKTRIKPPPPPPPTTVKIVKVAKVKKQKQVKSKVKRPRPKKAAKAGRASDAPKTKSKSNTKTLTAKNKGKGKGISKGTSPKKAPIDTQTVGLLGLFAKGGTQKSLKNAVDGSGVSAAAKGATGIGSKKAAGSGNVIGSGLNRVGKSGKGESTFGVSGVKTKGRGSGDRGYGSGGSIGGRGGINIEAGGDEESFEGSMDREAIKRVVNRHLNQLRTCYNRVLDKDPYAEGKVVLNWTILAGGNVGSAKSVSSEINNREMLRCMTSRLRSWKFPSPPDGQIGDITYPFVFTSAK